ncbi:MAG: ATP synthase subunit I [Lachnospiraceae bacterium]|nr:ATP synthase subunit I [Lachnospiraceae bacterium]
MTMKTKWAEHHALVELWIGTLILALPCEFLLLIFFEDRLNKTLGLVIGVLANMFLTWHMERTISKALDLDAKGANATAVSGYFLRYLLVFVLLAGCAFSKIADPICVFLGLMLRKPAAYIQPFTHRISEKVCGKEVFYRENVPPEVQDELYGKKEETKELDDATDSK